MYFPLAPNKHLQANVMLAWVNDRCINIYFKYLIIYLI